MELFSILRIIHIAAGITGFVVAPIALISKKGGRVHRKWGKVFFWSMTVVAFTAVIMAPMHGNIFLTLVAVFSFYLAFSGYRSLYRKDAYKTGHTAFIDWFFVIINTIFDMIGYSIWLEIHDLLPNAGQNAVSNAIWSSVWRACPSCQ